MNRQVGKFRQSGVPTRGSFSMRIPKEEKTIIKAVKHILSNYKNFGKPQPNMVTFVVLKLHYSGGSKSELGIPNTIPIPNVLKFSF